jgi:hypothetical protein
MKRKFSATKRKIQLLRLIWHVIGLIQPTNLNHKEDENYEKQQFFAFNNCFNLFYGPV